MNSQCQHDETKAERKARLKKERAEAIKGKEEWMKVRRMAFEQGGEHLHAHRKQIDDEHAHIGEIGPDEPPKNEPAPKKQKPKKHWATVEASGLRYG